MTPTSVSAPHTPTGRRQITNAQRQATAGLTGSFPPTTPGAVLAAFKKAAPALGYSRSLVDLIDYMMGLTIAADWEGKWSPIVWPSNAEMGDRLDRELSRIKELIRAALDAGLILPRDHGTRKRFGKRDQKTGRIVYAFGFDLSPLAERIPAFQQAAAEFEAKREEAKALRLEVSQLRASILNMAAFASDQNNVSLEWADLTAKVQDVATPARSLRDPLLLTPIVTQLRALQRQAEQALEPSHPVETDRARSENRPHYTTTNQLPISKLIANDASRPAQGSGGRNGIASPPTPEPPENAFRGFPITPSIVLQIAPSFRDWVPSAQPTWAEISEAAYTVRSGLGISQHAYGQACIVLGRYEAATAIAVISAKHDAGLVRSPGGLLRHMVEAHKTGTLRLDRTLFGLVDGAGGLNRTKNKPKISIEQQKETNRAANQTW